MPRLLLSLATVLIIQGCYASSGLDEEGEPVLAPLLMDECVATASPWYDVDGPASELPGTVRIWANYPLFSPDYSLELYVVDLVVEVDEELDARIDLANPSWETSQPMVLGRMRDEATWRVLTTPDLSCPPRPASVEWPVDR